MNHGPVEAIKRAAERAAYRCEFETGDPATDVAGQIKWSALSMLADELEGIVEDADLPGVEIQQGAIVEPGVIIGPGSRIGYYAIVRGNVRTGRNLRLGSYSSIEGDATIGDDVTIRGRVEIPNAIIGDRVSIYEGAGFYDTPRPPDGPNEPPVIEDDVTICCHASILGGVTVGAGSFIGARVFVAEDIPPGSYVTAALPELRIRPRR